MGIKIEDGVDLKAFKINQLATVIQIFFLCPRQCGSRSRRVKMYLIALLGLTAASYATGEVLEEGDICNDSSWTCEYFSNCKTAVSDVRRGKIPDVCGYDPDNDERIICCRPEIRTKPQTEEKPDKKRISLRKCEEYSEAAYVSKYVSAKGKYEKKLDCGVRSEQLIVGGVEASLKEFPHQAHIGYGRKSNTVWLCGGSLISEKWILSAAHCTSTSKGPPKWARLGELDYSSDTDGAEPKIVGIKKAINHEGYVDGRLYNDIALYELAEILQFTPHIRPLCLHQPDSESNKFDQSAVASGWGRTADSGHTSSRLLKVKLNYVSNSICTKAYRTSHGQLPDGIISSQICAGDEQMKDTCQGDSGGPLQRYLDNVQCMYELVGLTSFGSACGGGVPGVYTRISYFVPWIEKIVWPNQ